MGTAEHEKCRVSVNMQFGSHGGRDGQCIDIVVYRDIKSSR